MSKLNTREKKRITHDWQAELPALSIHKPLQLLRRAGPLLIGVCLERTSSGDRYSPVFHFHNLLIPRDDITLTLAQPLCSLRNTNVPEMITLSTHTPKYVDAAARLVEEHPLLASEQVHTYDIFSEYVDYLVEEKDISLTRYPLGIYLDTFTLAKCFGFDDYADELFSFTCTKLISWPKTEFGFPLEDWKERILGLASAETQRKVLADEIQRHRLESVVCLEPVIDGEPKKYWA